MPKYPYKQIDSLDFGRTFRNEQNQNLLDIETDLKDHDTRIDNIVGQTGESNTEIVDARYDSVNGVTHAVLKDRLDNTASQLAEKAQQSYVDSQDNLKRDKNQPIYMADLSTEVKTNMTGGSVAVVKENSVGSENIINKKVTIEKTDFLNNNSPNLFNKDTATPGYYINDTNGSLVANAGFSVSAFIPVSPSTTYVKNNSVTSYAIYDINNVYISSASSNTINVPSNGAFVRFTIPNADLGTQMFSKTSLPSSYTPYYYDVKMKDNIRINEINCDFLAYKSNTVNLFDKNSITDNKYVVNTTGLLGNSTGYATTDFIPVYKNKTYVTNNVVTSYAFYDINKKYINGADGNSAVAPSNAFYIRWSIDKSKITVDDFMITEQGYMPSYYVAYQKRLNFTDFTPKPNDNPLHGRTALFNGDSICMANWWTGYVGQKMGYAYLIGTSNNMTYVNDAVGGGTVAYKDNATYCISRSIANMQSTADFVILEGGLNDFLQNIPLGTITPNYGSTFDDTTFCGAFESMLKQVLLKYQGKKIGYVLVHKTRGHSYPYGRTTAGVEVYWDKAREICKKWSVPVLDLFNDSGLNPDIDTINTNYFYTADGVHPLEKGYREFLAPKIEAWMKTL